jgi:GNAT superfamily N-acetyltransferase
VRSATAADLPALTALFHEMEVHYEGTAALGEAAVRSALERHLFPADSAIHLLVAEDEGRLLGFASVSLLFPAAMLAPALFLKDIFVSTGARSRGVGTTLLRAVARLAVARGCTRVNWNTGRDNTAALAFYRRMGARVWEDVVSLRVDGEALARLAAEAGDGWFPAIPSPAAAGRRPRSPAGRRRPPA